MPAPLALLAALAPLPQAPLHTFHGDSPNDEFGVATAIVGDANRDGYADILVGAHWDDNNGSNSGTARLFSGLDGATLGTFNGDAANDFFGMAVAGVGDVNGDGYGEFAVGADSADMGGANAGLVRVFSGQSGAVIRNIPGSVTGELFGASLAGAGGIVIVGAPASDLARAVEASTGVVVWNFYSVAPGDQFGSSVAMGRDVDGDGIDDYAVGAPSDDTGGTDSGSVTIFSGSTGVQLRVLRGVAAGDRFGSSIALMPDVDGDGRGEILVGAPRANGPGADAGAVYLYSGATGSPIFTRVGEAAGDQFGISVASMAGATGFPDPEFVVGARWNDVGGANAGAAYVYSGTNGALLRVLRGHGPGDWFGGAVAGGGDVDGNGTSDFVVSARLADINGSDSGTVEVHPSPVIPRTWYVDAAVAGPGEGTQLSPYRSIQYAINNDSTRSGDFIRIAPGVYLENLELKGKALKLVRDGIARPVLDGGNSAPVLRIEGHQFAGTRLEGLLIRNGKGFYPDPNNPGDSYGGGVYAYNSCLDIDDCIIRDNTSDECGRLYGIGIYATGPYLAVRNSQITNNSALMGGCSAPWGSGGGGVYAICGSIEIVDCEVTLNSLEARMGGGISATGSQVTIRGCLVSHNHVNFGEFGGGIAIQAAANGLIDACVIDSNSSFDAGGGVAVLGGSVLVRNCQISENRAGNGYGGGGLIANGPGTRVEDTVLARNVEYRGGGAAGPILALRCTFFQNVAWEDWSGSNCAGLGGGLYQGTAIACLFDGNTLLAHDSCGGAASAAYQSTLINCTIVNSYAGVGPENYSVLGGSLNSCILWGNDGLSLDSSSIAIYSNIEGGTPGTGNLNTDPLFLSPGHNAHLSVLSPCIDAGDPTSPLDPDGSRADMGAFPFDPSYCPPPFVYCTGKANSCGAQPSIAWAGSPNLSATTAFMITATGARAARPGILLYSPNGMANSPFQGGTLCIAAQGLRRSPQVTSIGGSGGTACDAAFSIDWTAFALGGLGGTPQPYLRQLGQRVNVQWWGRDNLVVGSFLSNAIQYEVCP